jgi:hypothetical protein
LQCWLVLLEPCTWHSAFNRALHLNVTIHRGFSVPLSDFSAITCILLLYCSCWTWRGTSILIPNYKYHLGIIDCMVNQTLCSFEIIYIDQHTFRLGLAWENATVEELFKITGLHFRTNKSGLPSMVFSSLWPPDVGELSRSFESAIMIIIIYRMTSKTPTLISFETSGRLSCIRLWWITWRYNGLFYSQKSLLQQIQFLSD